MNKENLYSESVRTLSDDELKQYIEDPDTYQEGAVIAAIWELEKRGFTNAKSEKLLDKLSEGFEKENQKTPTEPIKKEAVENPEKIEIDKEVPEKDLPRLFTRNIIMIYSILFSTFVGSILMAINLNRLKKERDALYVLLFGVGFSYLVNYLMSKLNMSMTVLPVLINVIGALLIDNLFWKKHIGLEMKFQKQPIKGLLIITASIILIFIIMIMKNPEVMDQFLK